VYRFDGELFAHFSLDSGLRSSASEAIAIRADGAVCVGSRGGLGCWNGTRFSQEGARGVPPAEIRRLVSFGDKLWIGTEGAGLYMQAADRAVVPAPGWPTGRASVVDALWADAEGVVAADGADVLLGTGNGTWRSIGDVGIGREPVSGLLRDRDGALWIRTPSHIWLLPHGATRATDIGEGLPSGYDVTGTPSGMAIGPLGDVLVGTDVGIAYRERGRWHLIDRAVGAPGAAARSIFVDSENTVWVGAVGLYQLRGRGVVERHDLASGLPGNIMWGARRDARGTLWLGTNRCLARAVARRWECVHGTETRVVRTMAFLPQGGMFVGGSPSDLLYIDAEGHPSSGGDFDRPEDRTILALALGPDGDLWIATSKGLHRLPRAVPGPIQHVVIPGVRSDARFAALAVVAGQLWTATDEGILVLEDGAW
jgi:ligand-binding sensor domain-containing protein